MSLFAPIAKIASWLSLPMAKKNAPRADGLPLTTSVISEKTFYRVGNKLFSDFHAAYWWQKMVNNAPQKDTDYGAIRFAVGCTAFVITCLFFGWFVTEIVIAYQKEA